MPLLCRAPTFLRLASAPGQSPYPRGGGPSFVSRSTCDPHFNRDKLDLFLKNEGKGGTVFFLLNRSKGVSRGAQVRFLPRARDGHTADNALVRID